MAKESNSAVVTTNLGRRMYGRREIFTNETIITSENVLKVLNKALQTHLANRSEIEYLMNYRRGKQPVEDRVKSVNAEICNKIVVNLANEIIAFKVANFAGEPLQYVSRGSDETTPGKIERLNSMMLSENKATKDMKLADWMFTCGVGYRLTLNDKQKDYYYAQQDGRDFDEAPFEVETLDSRNSFVVKLNRVGHKPVMGVTYVFKDENKAEVEFTCYTKDAVYTIAGTNVRGAKVVDVNYHNNGRVPIVEYPCNTLRMGAFEAVLPLLDAINTTESNRLDGVEQFIQAIMVFQGVDITREQFLELKDLGAIKLPPDANGNASKVYYLNEQLDQSQTQTLVDAMTQEVYEIVGLPSQGSGNTADSSNNGAAYIKNGGWGAETRTRETIGMWRESETEFLKLILHICSDANAVDLKISEIEVKFPRNSYEDKLVKVQSFTTLISANVPPVQAYEISGIVTDPEAAAIVYEKYQEDRANAELDGLDEYTRQVELVSRERAARDGE